MLRYFHGLHDQHRVYFVNERNAIAEEDMKTSKILVMCTGNSFRSQLAEGYLRHFCGDNAEVFSAGVRASGRVAKESIELMAEEGIDITAQSSTMASVYANDPFDFVFTLGHVARDNSPEFPGAQKIHHEFPDPEPEDGESKDHFRGRQREVRNMIREYFTLFASEQFGSRNKG